MLKKVEFSSTPYPIKIQAKPLPTEPEPHPQKEEQEQTLLAAREQVIKEAELQAQELLAQAQQRSQTILAQAKQEGYDQGYAQGKEEGIVQGRTESLAAVQPILAQAQEVLAQTLGLEAEIQHQLERSLAKLALAIARKVVGELAAEKEELVLYTAKRALQKVRGELQVTIRVNLKDLEFIGQERTTLLAQADGIREIKIVDDPRVEPGGCLIETNLGTIDARLETQFAELAKLAEEGKDSGQAGSRQLPGES